MPKKHLKKADIHFSYKKLFQLGRRNLLKTKRQQKQANESIPSERRDAGFSLFTNLRNIHVNYPKKSIFLKL
jgi:hypothetical protein